MNVSFEQEKKPRTRSRQREDGTFESPPLDDQWPFLPAERRAATIAMLRGEDAGA